MIAELIRWALIGGAVLLLSWAILIVLARRLPPGVAKDLATVLPACATTTAPGSQKGTGAKPN